MDEEWFLKFVAEFEADLYRDYHKVSGICFQIG